MKNSQRIVRQWAGWQLVCIAEEEYLLVRRGGFNVDFGAANDGDAVTEAVRLMSEIDGDSGHAL
ncbi:MAG: hypothetical protein LBD10_04875 [Desulfobulbus sp.]|jgi:hypothetical protein|uniref:hypothetical protein n=1 Tax=Desulfobulbus sp. TaxID=895 RepID=UPI00283AF0C0|nr:hypothetical protein [Desulfobulbus sp.]MDR2549517.1 hypothetical protein [Desulfobulbus sp.]